MEARNLVVLGIVLSQNIVDLVKIRNCSALAWAKECVKYFDDFCVQGRQTAQNDQEDRYETERLNRMTYLGVFSCVVPPSFEIA